MNKNVFLWSLLILLFFFNMTLSAATLRGSVRDIFNKPVRAVRVSCPNAGQKTFTDNDGRFAIEISGLPERVQLLFSAVRYHSETLLVERADYEKEIKLYLTPRQMIREDMTISAPRQEVTLSETPAAASVIGPEILSTIPRGVAADEALKTVPGVKVDNQANGERVHLSIRGIGILTERGIRGIQVMLDGIPLNDPSGFAPDLFDVDWTTVETIEVIRGPMGFLYGGGSSGGVLNITTRDGSDLPVTGSAWASVGSYGFWKAMAETGGTAGSDKNLNWRFSLSHGAGDGYRDHTAFWSNNLYGKLKWQASPRFNLTAMVSGTGFFNENAEGLNNAWLLEDRRMANPDAITYNEFQKTRRVTTGINGLWNLSEQSAIFLILYGRSTLWLESVPSSVQHRNLLAPGLMLQYQLDFGKENFRNHFSTGIDWGMQFIDDLRHPNLGNALEGDSLVADQNITQKYLGIFVIDRINLDSRSRWSLLLGLRHDRFGNELNDHLQAGGLDLSGSSDFNRTTARLGINWNPVQNWGIYTSWGSGFLPPATEELYANPDALGGFNSNLVPATSSGFEIGTRGNQNRKLFYDLALFHLITHDDFERYRMPERPLETFYRNAGNSRRNGLEASLTWYLLDPLTLTMAYTYSDFTFTEYVSLTYTGDLSGNLLPNSPRHQIYLDARLRLDSNWFISASLEGFSRAYIDATNETWIDGYVLLGGRFGYRWSGRAIQGEIIVTAKNITNQEYIAFTEPDPDGNSYQPGPTREIFITAQLRF
jgi:iron complex outermembrane receptor protein